MSGFGGSWQRRTRADALRYPVFKRMMEEQLAAREAVSNMGPPKAIGDVHYLGTAAIDAECADFRAALAETGTHFAEPFVTAPSPGIIAGAMKNEHYHSEEAYLDALGAALRPEYEAIIRHGFLLQLDCPDLALERHLSYQDHARSAIFWALSSALSRRSTRPWETSHATRCGCMSAGAITRVRMIATCRSPTSCRSSGRPRSAHFSSPLPTPGTPTNTKSFRSCR
jgi:hypothetical protein